MRPQALFSIIAFVLSAGTPFAGAAESDVPARVVTLPTEQIGSDVPGPQSPAAARQEALAAYAENRRACRDETDRSARRDCLAAAKADRDRLLDYASQAATSR